MFIFIHWLITKSHRVWATCVSTSKKGGTQVLADVNQLYRVTAFFYLILPIVKEKTYFINQKGYFLKRYCTKQIA